MKASKTIDFTDLSLSPVGRITLISTIRGGIGVVPRAPFRVYPAYALVLITRGRGSYRDESGLEAAVEEGDAVLVFPGLAHMYGPEAGTRWDEFYAIFDGPAFDTWRSVGLLNPGCPVIKRTPDIDIEGRLRQVAQIQRAEPATGRALQVCALLALLSELCPQNGAQPPSPPKAWATRACALLARTGPDEPTLEGTARDMGVSVATFRRRFTAEVGVPPALWRARRRMEAACHLMQYSQMTFAQMVDQLGYADEYHFSKRFTQLIGVTPSAFRHRVRNNL